MDTPGSTKTSLLDAAEHLFARKGLAGASMRMIAERANAPQSLLHYHFGTKEKLFEAVFARRAEQINSRRRERLSALMGQGTLPAIEDVLDALFRPTLEPLAGPSGLGDFPMILGSAATSDEPLAKRLIHEHYDPIAALFTDAFARVLGLERETAVWGYFIVTSASTQLMARTGRIERFSDGRIAEGEVEPLIRNLIRFAAAGLRALGDGVP